MPFRIIAVIVDDDDPRAIETIAGSCLAMQDEGTYATETEASDQLVNLAEDWATRDDIAERHAAYHGIAPAEGGKS